MRALIFATVVTFTGLTGVAFQTAQAPMIRPTLLVLKSEHCPPCIAWVQAYDNVLDGRLRTSINGRFDLKANFASDRPDLVERYRVERFPTFIVLGRDCKELDRVVGFPGSLALWQQLTDGVNPYAQQATPQRNDQRPPRQPTTPRAGSGASDVIKRISDANDHLQAERECLQNSVEELRDQLSIAREASNTTPPPAEPDPRIGRLETAIERLQQQLQNAERFLQQPVAPDPRIAELQSELETLRQQSSEPSTDDLPDWLADELQPAAPPATDISAEIPDDIESSSTAESWRSWGRWAAGIGLTLLAPEVAVPGSIGLSALGFGINWYRKRSAAASLEDSSEEKSAESVEDYELPTLPFQDLDYAKTWAEHAMHEGRAPELAAREYAHYVNAFDAVRRGEITLPGIGDGERFGRQIRKWVLKQFRARVKASPDHSNPNHKAMYAFLHRQAMENMRNGTFNESSPNPKAADVLEDWVNERVVGDLVFTPE